MRQSAKEGSRGEHDRNLMIDSIYLQRSQRPLATPPPPSARNKTQKRPKRKTKQGQATKVAAETYSASSPIFCRWELSQMRYAWRCMRSRRALGESSWSPSADRSAIGPPSMIVEETFSHSLPIRQGRGWGRVERRDRCRCDVGSTSLATQHNQKKTKQKKKKKTKPAQHDGLVAKRRAVCPPSTKR